MNNTNKKVSIEIDFSARIDKAKQAVQTLKSQIGEFDLSKGLTADFAKEFKAIEREIIEIQRRVANGEINLLDAGAAEKSIDKIEKKWAFLVSKIGKEGFLDKGLKLDAQAISALETAQDVYNQSMKDTEARHQRLNKNLEKAKQHQQELLEIQKQQTIVSQAVYDAQRQKTEWVEREEKVAKKARDDAEKVLRTKVAESGGKYSMEDVTKKGSNLRKTDAYKEYAAKNAAYEEAKKKTTNEKTTQNKMTTVGLQAAEAEKAKQAIEEATTALEAFKKATLETAKVNAFKASLEALSKMEGFKDIDFSQFGIDLSQIKNAEQLEEALTNLRIEAGEKTTKALSKMENTAEEASTEFDRMAQDIDDAKDTLEDFSEEARQLEEFETNIKRFLGMAGAVELFRKALSSAFETIRQLDSAMTEMAVVTELGIGDYWEQLPEHTERARELGVAIKDVYEAETLYYQQGLRTNEVIALSNETLKMARIAGLSAEDATNKMTAALRGFNMELNETSAQRVADVYSELAAITAADVGQISNAMSKTASIASSAGMEFETTAAFLSQIIETTQESAETAGTALKTVIARFQELKKDPAEIGEVDGEIVDANQIEGALRSVGVSLRDANGQFRDLDDVFLELSKKWGSLDKNTQRYIATVAAGSRQQSRFIAMMSDYGRTQELVAAANDSNGASQEQFNKTLESLSVKLEQLKAAWDEFAMGILESDLVKFGVEALTKILEIINKATSAFGGLGGTITKVLTTIVMFKLGSKVFEKIKNPLKTFFVDLVKDIYSEGEKGGEAYANGMRNAKAKAKTTQSSKPSSDTSKTNTENGETVSEEGVEGEGETPQKPQQKGIKGWNDRRKENYANLKKTRGDYKKATANKEEIKKKRQQAKDAKEQGWDRKGNEKAGEEAKKARESYQELNVEINAYDQNVQKAKEASNAAWSDMGKTIGQAGEGITAIGVGVSMVGGLMSSLGLEEAGTVISGIGSAITMVGGALMIIPPILTLITAHPIIAIITAIAAVVIGLIAAIVSFVQNNSLDAKLANAKKNLEDAKAAAEAAKGELDEMMSARDGYNDLQQQLKGLVKGTNEWKEALRASNEQVLELLETYPELAHYITKGESGELQISDAGWDQIIADQKKAANNAQGMVMQAQLEVKEVEMTAVKEDYTNASKVYSQDSDGNLRYDPIKTSGLREELEQIYLVGESSLDAMDGKAEELAKKYGITTEAVKRAGQELDKASSSINDISEQSESIARSYLTTMASETVTNSDFGDAAVDAFANSVNSEASQAAVDKQVAKLKEGSDYKDSAEFDRLAKEYGVEDQMTGGDTHDLQTLYAAVAGLESIEDIPDGIAESREKMLEGIAKADVNNKLLKGMEEYTLKLEKLSEQDSAKAQNIAGLLSDEGQGMTREFADSFMKNTPDGQVFDRSQVDAQAEAFGGIEKWAETVGKTTEELYDEIEKNVRSSIAINENSYNKLNRVLKTTDNKITSFGDKVNVSTKNVTYLSEKIVGATAFAGEEGGRAIKDSLDAILASAGEDADQLANILGTMNWNSTEEWERLPETLEALGISVKDTDLETLISQIEQYGIAVEKVDYDAVTKKIQDMYNTFQSIQSGEQGRNLDEGTYKQLVMADSNLANSFVRVGDEFHYVGSSLTELASAMKIAAAVEAKKATIQLESQLSIAKSVAKFEETGATFSNKKLKLSDGDYSTDWSKAEKVAYLEQYVKSAKEQGVESLAYVTDEQGNNLGMSLGANFNNYTDEKLNEFLRGIHGLDNQKDTLETETKKQQSDNVVASYTLLDTASNITNAQTAREGGKEEAADEYAKAVSIQAASSGMIAEAVLSEYNSLIEADSSDPEVRARMKEIEGVIAKGLEKNAQALEHLNKLNDLSNQIMEAQKSIRQHEIDKLSEINDSVTTAGENLVSKISEQIQADREAREMQKQKDKLADKQSQLMYLMGTSGGSNQLAAQSLQQQIQEEQQSLEDSLVDQSLQNLTDANAAAAEQRERQIEMMQAALDNDIETGALAREAEAMMIEGLQQINDGLNPLSTRMYEILSQAEKIDGNMVTKNQQDEFNSSFIQSAADTANSYDSLINTTATKEGQGESLAIETAIKNWLLKEEERAKTEAERVSKEQTQQTTRENHVKAATTAINNNDRSSYEAEKAKYVAAGGDPDTFKDQVKNEAMTNQSGYSQMNDKGELITGRLGTFKAVGYSDPPAGNYDAVDVTVNGTKFTGLQAYYKTRGFMGFGGDYEDGDKKGTSSSLSSEITEATYPTGSPARGDVVLYQGKAYIYRSESERWSELLYKGFKTPDDLITKMKTELNAYEQGGLADFTGPAWLDGTKARPEMVLNARDTQNFIQLKDILAEILEGTNHTTNNSQSRQSNVNTFDIDINVESLKDDYDVEQLADKIRSMLYEDASYRNVNNVSLMR